MREWAPLTPTPSLLVLAPRTLHHCDSSHRTYGLDSPPLFCTRSIASISASPRSIGLLLVECRVSERDSNVHRDREAYAYMDMRCVRI
jgi:hypothetical protein